MSQTAKALLFKLVMSLVFAWIAFGLIGVNAIEWTLLTGVLAAVLDYLVGDLLILPRVGSLIGAGINGVLAALIPLGVALIVPAFIVTAATVLTFAVLIAVGEYFFHRYLLEADKVAPEPQ